MSAILAEPRDRAITRGVAFDGIRCGAHRPAPPYPSVSLKNATVRSQATLAFSGE